jgi:hypothetical protein
LVDYGWDIARRQARGLGDWLRRLRRCLSRYSSLPLPPPGFLWYGHPGACPTLPS